MRMDELELKRRVGLRLQAAIDRAGTTQAELADKIDWLTTSTLNSWVKGHRMLPLDKAMMLAPYLGCTAAYLMTLEEAPQEDKQLEALTRLYKNTDERGKSLILRVAEQESSYNAIDSAHEKSA